MRDCERCDHCKTSFNVDLVLNDDLDSRIMFEGMEDKHGVKLGNGVEKVTSYHSATILLGVFECFRVLKNRFAWNSSIFVVRGVLSKVLLYALVACAFFFLSMSIRTDSIVMADIRSIRSSLNTGVTFLLTAYITRCIIRWYSIVVVRSIVFIYETPPVRYDAGARHHASPMTNRCTVTASIGWSRCIGVQGFNRAYHSLVCLCLSLALLCVRVRVRVHRTNAETSALFSPTSTR